MMEMLDAAGHEDGSADRYQARVERFKRADAPIMRHRIWWLIHNCVAHPLIGLVPVRAFFRFHDWTARKINHPRVPVGRFPYGEPGQPGDRSKTT